MSEAEFSKKEVVAAVGAITATYIYFLLYAEFALLGLAQPTVAAGGSLRAVMGVLGAGGVAGSIVAARWFRPERFKRALLGGFLATALAAGLSLGAAAGGFFILVAGLVGLSLGWLTVTLASGLRSALGVKRLGLLCGLGTGLAYALCNEPAVFATTSAGQTWIAMGAVIIGAVLTQWTAVRPVRMETAGDYARGPATAWVIVLLALVWLDSAAFYIIQHTPDFKAATWAGAWTLGGNAAMHLVAAIGAGWVLDRGRAAGVLAVAGGFLVVACLLLRAGAPSAWVPVFYTAVCRSTRRRSFIIRRAGRGRTWPRSVSRWRGGSDRRWASAWRRIFRASQFGFWGSRRG